jgi:HNH endonuclease
LGSKEALTATRLRQLLAYDANTGIFRWRARPITKPQHKSWNTKYASNAAGTSQSGGYRQIQVDGKKHLAQNLAWLHFYGEMPARGPDHINLDQADNRICNLRLATPSQNNANRRRPRNNSSGKKGVYLYRRKWHATITKDYKHYYLGSFDGIDQAAAAYAAKSVELYGDFARTD